MLETAHNKNVLLAFVSLFGIFLLIGLLILYSRNSGKAVETASPMASSERTVQPTVSKQQSVNSQIASGPTPSPSAGPNPVPETLAATGPVIPDGLVTENSADAIIKEFYLNYSKDTLEVTLEENGRALLYFYADWCPVCRIAEKSILQEGHTLPDNLKIIKVNFDTEELLKQKYGVTVQDTVVFIDRSGKELNKWKGGKFETILENLNLN